MMMMMTFSEILVCPSNFMLMIWWNRGTDCSRRCRNIVTSDTWGVPTSGIYFSLKLDKSNPLKERELVRSIFGLNVYVEIKLSSLNYSMK